MYFNTDTADAFYSQVTNATSEAYSPPARHDSSHSANADAVCSVDTQGLCSSGARTPECSAAAWPARQRNVSSPVYRTQRDSQDVRGYTPNVANRNACHQTQSKPQTRPSSAVSAMRGTTRLLTSRQRASSSVLSVGSGAWERADYLPRTSRPSLSEEVASLPVAQGSTRGESSRCPASHVTAPQIRSGSGNSAHPRLPPPPANALDKRAFRTAAAGDQHIKSPRSSTAPAVGGSTPVGPRPDQHPSSDKANGSTYVSNGVNGGPSVQTTSTAGTDGPLRGESPKISPKLAPRSPPPMPAPSAVAAATVLRQVFSRRLLDEVTAAALTQTTTSHAASSSPTKTLRPGQSPPPPYPHETAGKTPTTRAYLHAMEGREEKAPMAKAGRAEPSLTMSSSPPYRRAGEHNMPDAVAKRNGDDVVLWWTIDVVLTDVALAHPTTGAQAAALLRSPEDMRMLCSLQCRAPVLPIDAPAKDALESTRSFLRNIALTWVGTCVPPPPPCVPLAYLYFDSEFNQYVQLMEETVALASTVFRVVMATSSLMGGEKTAAPPREPRSSHNHMTGHASVRHSPGHSRSRSPHIDVARADDISPVNGRMNDNGGRRSANASPPLHHISSSPYAGHPMPQAPRSSRSSERDTPPPLPLPPTVHSGRSTYRPSDTRPFTKRNEAVAEGYAVPRRQRNAKNARTSPPARGDMREARAMDLYDKTFGYPQDAETTTEGQWIRNAAPVTERGRQVGTMGCAVPSAEGRWRDKFDRLRKGRVPSSPFTFSYDDRGYGSRTDAVPWGTEPEDMFREDGSDDSADRVAPEIEPIIEDVIREAVWQGACATERLLRTNFSRRSEYDVDGVRHARGANQFPLRPHPPQKQTFFDDPVLQRHSSYPFTTASSSLSRGTTTLGLYEARTASVRMRSLTPVATMPTPPLQPSPSHKVYRLFLHPYFDPSRATPEVSPCEPEAGVAHFSRADSNHCTRAHDLAEAKEDVIGHALDAVLRRSAQEREIARTSPRPHLPLHFSQPSPPAFSSEEKEGGLEAKGAAPLSSALPVHPTTSSLGTPARCVLEIAPHRCNPATEPEATAIDEGNCTVGPVSSVTHDDGPCAETQIVAIAPHEERERGDGVLEMSGEPETALAVPSFFSSPPEDAESRIIGGRESRDGASAGMDTEADTQMKPLPISLEVEASLLKTEEEVAGQAVEPSKTEWHPAVKSEVTSVAEDWNEAPSPVDSTMIAEHPNGSSCDKDAVLPAVCEYEAREEHLSAAQLDRREALVTGDEPTGITGGDAAAMVPKTESDAICAHAKIVSIVEVRESFAKTGPPSSDLEATPLPIHEDDGKRQELLAVSGMQLVREGSDDVLQPLRSIDVAADAPPLMAESLQDAEESAKEEEVLPTVLSDFAQVPQEDVAQALIDDTDHASSASGMDSEDKLPLTHPTEVAGPTKINVNPDVPQQVLDHVAAAYSPAVVAVSIDGDTPTESNARRSMAEEGHAAAVTRDAGIIADHHASTTPAEQYGEGSPSEGAISARAATTVSEDGTLLDMPMNFLHDSFAVTQSPTQQQRQHPLYSMDQEAHLSITGSADVAGALVSATGSIHHALPALQQLSPETSSDKGTRAVADVSEMARAESETRDWEETENVEEIQIEGEGEVVLSNAQDSRAETAEIMRCSAAEEPAPKLLFEDAEAAAKMYEPAPLVSAIGPLSLSMFASSLPTPAISAEMTPPNVPPPSTTSEEGYKGMDEAMRSREDGDRGGILITTATPETLVAERVDFGEVPVLSPLSLQDPTTAARTVAVEATIPPLPLPQLEDPSPIVQMPLLAPPVEMIQQKTSVLLSFPGSSWAFVVTLHYEAMRAAFIKDAASAVELPESAILDVRFGVGSLTVDLYVLHSMSVDPMDIRDRISNFEYPTLWGIYEENKRHQKKLRRRYAHPTPGDPAEPPSSPKHPPLLSSEEVVNWPDA